MTLFRGLNGAIHRVCRLELTMLPSTLTASLDNLGAILATADVLTRAAISSGKAQSIVTMGDVLLALIKAYEIQGCFQICNAFNRVGLDHTILVKIASTAVVSWLMGLEPDQARSAVSHAWVDGHPLRIYRQAPNAGPRKGWAAGDACMRAVHLALLARNGQPGLRTALTAPRWGFYQVLYGGKEFELPRPYGSWVAENIVFKVVTAEGHGLTAAEAAWHLARRVKESDLDATRDIKSIHVRTQKPAMIIINKQGPLHNAADRDHCLRYMVAVILLKMEQVETSDYQDDSPWATDPRVEALRSITTMEEDLQFTQDYHNPDIRSAANAIEITLHDGTKMEQRIDFPLGHAQRGETLNLVRLKAVHNLELGLSPAQVRRIIETVDGPDFDKLPASHFIDLFQP
jgi:2-methylcitrate dehydratase